MSSSTLSSFSGVASGSRLALSVLAALAMANLNNNAQITVSAQTLPSSAPFAYEGMPETPYGPDWQSYYEVTEPLPNITWTLPRSFAGSVSVDRQNHPDNTLFFYAFEHESGSLTVAEGERANEPWIIWLNGGPGSSSLYGLFNELGPIRIGPKDVPSENPWSWDKLADIFFVDQPVGTGYSTVEADGYVVDEDMMGEDFARFLANIVSIFPSLKSRPLFLTGESYAGIYIPYISKTLFSMEKPPVNLAKVAIGNGAIGTTAAFEQFSVMTIIDTFPQMINFDPKVYAFFAEQYSLCGYNLTFSYPEKNGKYPPLTIKGLPYYAKGKKSALSDLKSLVSVLGANSVGPVLPLKKRQDLKYPIPELTGTINEDYGCWLVEELIDFSTRHIAPWTEGFTFYDLADTLSPPAPDDPQGYLNLPEVREALHAPKKKWTLSIRYPFGSAFQSGGNLYNDPSPEAQVLFDDLAKNVSIVLFSGNNDGLVAHRGTELVIQNTTFGGIQGFTKPPSTPFTDDEGNFGGIVHQERNLTYALFPNAGHMVPLSQPKAAFAFVREFILGSNTTGLVGANGSVVGGQDEELAEGFIQEKDIHGGEYSTETTLTWAEETWSAWDAFVATRTAGVGSDGDLDQEDDGPAPVDENGNPVKQSAATRVGASWTVMLGQICFTFAVVGLFFS